MLTKMFNPKSIAVIGASETPGKVGYAIMQNLKDFKGEVIPVNVKGEIKVLDRYVDLVIVAIPSKFVLNEMVRIGELGIKNVVVISAGFKEVGEILLEMDLVKIVEKYDMNMVGPNVFGIANGKISLNATFGDMPTKFNKISLFSQSGAVIASINDMANKMGIGFSKMVSLGNKATFTEIEMLSYLRDDPDTDVIIGYLEEISDGPKFIKLASSIDKPIVLIKAGRTAKGGAAAASHTGSIAGSDNAYETAFKKAGILRVKSVSDLLLYAKVLESKPLPKGKNIGIITNGGGAGIMATDDVIDAGMELADIDEFTKKVLKLELMDDSSVKNPVDILGAGTPYHYRVSTVLLNDDDNVDAIIILSCPQTVIPVNEIIDSIGSVISDKPILSTFEYGEDIVKALDVLVKYAEIKSNSVILEEPKFMKLRPMKIDKDVLGVESFDLLESYGIPVAKSYSAIEDNFEYPVVAKVVDEKVSHKSDAGGVILNIQNKEELDIAINKLLDIGDNFQIQPMIKGKEIIVGMIRDPTFGPMIMVGLGGIYVEILKDVSFGIAPLSKIEARNMIENLKTIKLLKGVRGEKPVDIDAIVDILIKISMLAIDYPELKELEINPLMVSEKGAIAVDFRAMR